MADRLLDVDVFAGLHRPDGGQGVPVIRRGDGDGINRFVVEYLAEVLFELGGLVLLLFGKGHSRANDRLVSVANGGDEAIGPAGQLFHVVLASTIDADHRDAELLVDIALLDRLGLFLSLHWDLVKAGQQGRQSGRVVDEFPTIHEFHKRPRDGMVEKVLTLVRSLMYSEEGVLVNHFPMLDSSLWLG